MMPSVITCFYLCTFKLMTISYYISVTLKRICPSRREDLSYYIMEITRLNLG